MSRRRINFIVDIVSLLVLLVLIQTGLIIKYALPPGSRGGQGLSLAGWTRHEWGDLHFWFAVSMAVLMVVHVVLHWQWVCGTVRGLFVTETTTADRAASGSETAYGLVFLVVVVFAVGGLFWLSYRNVVQTGLEEGEHGWRGGAGATGGSGEGQHRMGRGKERANEGAIDSDSATPTPAGESSEHIRGSMTLSDVQRATGVPVATLLRELGLPGDVSPDQRLGRLRQEYGVEIDRVREIVQQETRRAATTTSPS